MSNATVGLSARQISGEAERAKVDRAVLSFLEEAPHPADFTIRSDGVMRLNRGLAKNTASLVPLH